MSQYHKWKFLCNKISIIDDEISNCKWKCQKCGGEVWSMVKPEKTEFIWLDRLNDEVMEQVTWGNARYTGLTCDQYMILNTHMELS